MTPLMQGTCNCQAHGSREESHGCQGPRGGGSWPCLVGIVLAA